MPLIHNIRYPSTKCTVSCADEDGLFLGYVKVLYQLQLSVGMSQYYDFVWWSRSYRRGRRSCLSWSTCWDLHGSTEEECEKPKLHMESLLISLVCLICMWCNSILKYMKINYIQNKYNILPIICTRFIRELSQACPFVYLYVSVLETSWEPRGGFLWNVLLGVLRKTTELFKIILRFNNFISHCIWPYVHALMSGVTH